MPPQQIYKLYEQNSEYPPEAKNAGMDGRVDARFIVDKDGVIGSVGIINHFG